MTAATQKKPQASPFRATPALGILSFIARLFSLPVKIEPLVVGKASTVVQVGYIGLVLLLLTFSVGMPVLAEAAGIIAAGFTLMSWFSYGQLLFRAFFFGRRPA